MLHRIAASELMKVATFGCHRQLLQNNWDWVLMNASLTCKWIDSANTTKQGPKQGETVLARCPELYLLWCKQNIWCLMEWVTTNSLQHNLLDIVPSTLTFLLGSLFLNPHFLSKNRHVSKPCNNIFCHWNNAPVFYLVIVFVSCSLYLVSILRNGTQVHTFLYLRQRGIHRDEVPRLRVACVTCVRFTPLITPSASFHFSLK